MKKIFLLICLVSLSTFSYADEGMWILKELNRQSAERMKELGFTFPIDSLYNEKNPSLKDAVVIFGGGCTGVVVSQEGLIFTNHHCGYDAIQKHSTPEHNYLKDGFVSQSNAEELYTKDLTVKFLEKTEDVTARVVAGLKPSDSEERRYDVVDSISREILRDYRGKEFLSASVQPFYARNKYYLVVYRVFRDVRMVAAPPSSMGKFGGETDNWMWPRHTCDFSVFRVYANKNNEPAEYSADNVPYKPKYSVPVSLEGYKEKDYAMTIGYPGSTERYLPSWGITQMMESTNKPRIEVRTVKQDIWRATMLKDEAVQIKYATKFAQSANYWKNAMGMNSALTRLGVVGQKEELEQKFNNWLDANPDQKAIYGEALPLLKDTYTSSAEDTKVGTYYSETFLRGIEIARFASLFNRIEADQSQASGREKEALEKRKEAFEAETLPALYKDYDADLDQQVMPALMKLYAERVPKELQPDIYETINKKFKGDYTKYADWVFKHTNFKDLKSVLALTKENRKTIDKDPAIQLAVSLEACRKILADRIVPEQEKLERGNRIYMAGLMAMSPDKAFSPDANFTQRLSYGSIGGYSHADAVDYKYYTTTQGILEKQKPGDPEFGVQDYILDGIRAKNFGQYLDKDGTMHTDFLSNNDITGGNSGSPVFNGKAQLIGLAFDGNWESLSGDVAFEPKLQRTISVDIRFVLYTIDKVLGCPRLVDELQLKK